MEKKMDKKMDNQLAVIVLVGAPASGKTTAREMAADIWTGANSFHYSTDDAVDAIAAAQGVNYDDVWKDNIKAVTNKANMAVTDAIAANQNVIWDQTNMTAKKRGKILNLFPDAYRKECICILPPYTDKQNLELDRRLAMRSGKNIPDFVMENMLNSFVLPDMNEGFDRVLYFDIYGKMVSKDDALALFADPD